MRRILILASMILSAFTGELRAAANCRWVPSNATVVRKRRDQRPDLYRLVPPHTADMKRCNHGISGNSSDTRQR